MQQFWASNAPHRTPFSRGILAGNLRWLFFFWQLVIFFENQDPDCQTLKAATYPLKSPHFEPRFFHLAKNRKIFMHCLCNFNVEDDSNVVLCLAWLYNCCPYLGLDPAVPLPPGGGEWLVFSKWLTDFGAGAPPPPGRGTTETWHQRCWGNFLSLF